MTNDELIILGSGNSGLYFRFRYAKIGSPVSRAVEVVLVLIIALVGIGAPIWIDFRHWWPRKRRMKPGL